MTTRRVLLALVLAAAGELTGFAQQQPADPTRTPGVQAPNDPNRAAFVMANCKNAPPPPAPARGGGGGGGGQGARGGGGGRGDGRGGGAPAAAGPADYAVSAIPGVIAAGQRWRPLWTDTGNNADSPIGVQDGVFVAQNDQRQIRSE